MGSIPRGKKISFILLILLGFSMKAQQVYTEEQKIEHLIGYVAALKDAVFIRNGREYTAGQAADHLRLKRKKAGSEIKTAEDFITKAGSKSSMTGNPYLIRFSNGKEYACEMLLRLELKKFMQQKR